HNVVIFEEKAKSKCNGCLLQEIYKNNPTLLMKLEYKSRVYGILKLNLHEEDNIDELERSLFCKVANNIALALHNRALEDEQDRLKKENQIKAQLLDGAIDSILLHDFSGNILYANKAACKKLQYSKKGIVGKTLFDLEFQKDEDLITTRLEELKKEKNVKFKSIIRNKSGEKIPIEVHSKVIQVENKQHILGIFRDISSLKRAKKKIRTSKERYKMLFNNSPNPLIEIDLSEVKKDLDRSTLPPDQYCDNLASKNETTDWINKIKIVELNKDCLELFGSKNKVELLSKRLKVFTPHAAQKFLEIIKQFANHKVRYREELIMQTLRGKKVIVELYAQLMPTQRNDWSEIIISLHVITAQKEFEKIREQLMEQLHKSLEFKSRFLASTSHELRTPLNSILGFTDLLMEEVYGPVNSEQKNFLGDIKTSAQHLISLINQVLEHSKSLSGKISLNKQEVNLWEIISEIQAIIRPLYKDQNLNVSFSIPEKRKIRADPVRFKQIVYNLLSNAIKFTPQGEVSLEGIERSDHWEFQVRDTGIGIAPENYDKVFREFGQAHDYQIRKIQGTGLGLSLTKHLVELHGGEIWFESKEDMGSTFYFTLPK
ncbi:MAG: PAS domain-containing sensor histidine kinase, partial [Promethearchaeia archaeon]